MTSRSDPVWKALSDATRRTILDRLAYGPKTTGQLCRHFPVSRFAVMKHLAILTRAKLVLVRRTGRERWNHLNAVPLQRLYERWVRPRAGEWARKMLDVKSLLEPPTGGTAMTAKNAYGVASAELEIEIAAKPKRVWKALVDETTRWWSPDFYTNPATKGFHIDARLGGLGYEDWGNGHGQVWFTVTAVDAPNLLSMMGHLSAAYGSPALSLLDLRLEASGNGTLLKVSDTLFGSVGPGKSKQITEGWQMLFDAGLKTYVEAAWPVTSD